VPSASGIFCENGQYTERGIKGRNGYGSQQWRADLRFVVPVPVALGDHGLLTEPTSAREIVRALIAEAAATALDREAQWIRLSESLAEDEERQAIRRLDRLMQVSEESVGHPEATRPHCEVDQYSRRRSPTASWLW